MRKMPKIAILAIEDSYASSLTGFIDLLQISNSYAYKQLGDLVDPFEFKILSIDGASVKARGGLPISVHDKINDNLTFDLVFIPGIYYSGRQFIKNLEYLKSELTDWLLSQHTKGAIIAANCTGTFLLAETGLLNKKRATTTWWLEKKFKTRYPNTFLEIKQLITEDDNLICAGAITSHQHLAIRVIERFYTSSIASMCAKALLVDVGQTAQAPYLSLSSTTIHNNKLVSKAQYILQKSIKKPITMEALSDELAVSQRTLFRHFKDAIQMSPLYYLQNLRVEAAKQFLETTNLSVENIVREVGYDDTSSFSRLFQQRTGLTPTGYREKFSQTL